MSCPLSFLDHLIGRGDSETKRAKKEVLKCGKVTKTNKQQSGEREEQLSTLNFGPNRP